MKKDHLNSRFNATVRRRLYMAVAIIASVVLLQRPVFNFQDDKGIMYVRSFSMTEKTFVVTQTELATGIPHVTAVMSTKGLRICNYFMIAGCVLCWLCFFEDRWRVFIALVTALLAGVYYILMIYYAMRMSSDHYATLYPNFMAILPAIVLQMMVFVRRNVFHVNLEAEDNALEKNDQPIIR